MYVLRVRSRDRTAAAPLVVAGVPGRGAGTRARPLVVLPVITWQGLNRFDDDLDGFPDDLHGFPASGSEPPLREREAASGRPHARPRHCSRFSTAPACRTT